MPTFAISYLPEAEAGREAAHGLVPVVEELVPATMNDLYKITGDVAFMPERCCT